MLEWVLPVDLILVPGDIRLFLQGRQAAQGAQFGGGPLDLWECWVTIPTVLLQRFQPSIYLAKPCSLSITKDKSMAIQDKAYCLLVCGPIISENASA